MNKASIFSFMDKVTDVVKAASPLATMMGIPFIERIAGWADSAVEVGQNALNRAEEGKLVLNSKDKEQIEEKIKALQEINNGLHERVLNT